jgi:hypothetical protein
MVEPEEFKALRSSPKVHDPGLVGVQLQPEWCQGGFSQVPGRNSPFPAGAEDDEIIGEPGQCSQSPSRLLPRLVEDMEGDVGE